MPLLSAKKILQLQHYYIILKIVLPKPQSKSLKGWGLDNKILGALTFPFLDFSEKFVLIILMLKFQLKTLYVVLIKNTGIK